MKHQTIDEDPSTHSLYVPLPDAQILGVTRHGHITIRDSREEIVRRRISRVLVLIGSQPLLSFMGGRVTMESVRECNPATFGVEGQEGLYMVGSLAGSKFVRFGLGTTLAVAHSLVGDASSSRVLPGGKGKGHTVKEDHLDKRRKT